MYITFSICCIDGQSTNSLYFSLFLKTERAFQKQLTIPVVRRKNIPGQRKLRTRHYREVGLGFKTPKEVKIEFLLFHLTFSITQLNSAFMNQNVY